MIAEVPDLVELRRRTEIQSIQDILWRRTIVLKTGMYLHILQEEPYNSWQDSSPSVYVKDAVRWPIAFDVVGFGIGYMTS